MNLQQLFARDMKTVEMDFYEEHSSTTMIFGGETVTTVCVELDNILWDDACRMYFSISLAEMEDERL